MASLLLFSILMLFGVVRLVLRHRKLSLPGGLMAVAAITHTLLSFDTFITGTQYSAILGLSLFVALSSQLSKFYSGGDSLGRSGKSGGGS